MSGLGIRRECGRESGHLQRAPLGPTTPAVATAWRACSMQGSRPTWVKLCYPHCPLRGAFELHSAQASFCMTRRQKSGDEFTARTLMDSGCGTCWRPASQSKLHFSWPVFWRAQHARASLLTQESRDQELHSGGVMEGPLFGHSQAVWLALVYRSSVMSWSL